MHAPLLRALLFAFYLRPFQLPALSVSSLRGDGIVFQARFFSLSNSFLFVEVGFKWVSKSVRAAASHEGCA